MQEEELKGIVRDVIKEKVRAEIFDDFERELEAID